VPAHPYPSKCIPNKPMEPSSRASSRTGISVLSYQLAIFGLIRSRIYLRVTDCIARCSSLSSRSISSRAKGCEVSMAEQ
jgi:hypothetical protein